MAPFGTDIDLLMAFLVFRFSALGFIKIFSIFQQVLDPVVSLLDFPFSNHFKRPYLHSLFYLYSSKIRSTHVSNLCSFYSIDT